MKVLFLSPDFILPANRGLRVRVLSQLQLLASLEEVEKIKLLSLSAATAPADLLSELEQQVPKSMVEPPILRDTSVRSNLQAFGRFFNRRLLRNETYLLAVHDVRHMHDLIEHTLYADRYDVVYVGYLGMMAYAQQIRRLAPQAALVLEQHNIEWQIFDRLASTLAPPKRQLLAFEARALRRQEKQLIQQADSVISISGLDAAHFREMADIEPIVVPPFIELGQRQLATNPVDFRLGYIGHLTWQPNVHGLNWFCAEVWPKIRSTLPQVKLTLAGPGLPKDASGSIQVPSEWRCEGIDVVGYVDDLAALYRQTTCMIAPVIGGSGVRMKLLETLGAGMPTITTPDGASGLDVLDNRDLLIAHSPQDFAEGTLRLLTDPPLRQRLREGGFEYLRQNHSRESATQKLRTALLNALMKAQQRCARSSKEN